MQWLIDHGHASDAEGYFRDLVERGAYPQAGAPLHGADSFDSFIQGGPVPGGWNPELQAATPEQLEALRGIAFNGADLEGIPASRNMPVLLTTVIADPHTKVPTPASGKDAADRVYNSLVGTFSETSRSRPLSLSLSPLL